MLWLVRLDYVCLPATKNVEKLEPVFFLRAFHQLEVELILRIWLPLHIDRIVSKQITECAHGPSHFARDHIVFDLGIVSFDQIRVLVLESALAVLPLHVGDEACHQLIHRDWDVLLLVQSHLLVSELLQVVLNS